MNFVLPHIPERSAKPRENGLTMMMDKGLSIREAEDFIHSSTTYRSYKVRFWNILHNE